MEEETAGNGATGEGATPAATDGDTVGTAAVPDGGAAGTVAAKEDETPPTVPTIITENGADDVGFILSEADRQLDLVYGDHNHLNDGTQLDGGIEGDRRWQRRWKRLAELLPAHYAVPKGRVGRQFVDMLVTSELRRWHLVCLGQLVQEALMQWTSETG
jgi:hypothetical protein